MIFFYNFGTWILFSCGSSIIALFSIGIYLAKKKSHISVTSGVFMFGVLILSFVVASVLFLTVGSRLQFAIVEPYVQQSLDQQCGQGAYHANEGEVYNASGYYWKSNLDSTQCFAGRDGWNCRC